MVLLDGYFDIRDTSSLDHWLVQFFELFIVCVLFGCCFGCLAMTRRRPNDRPQRRSSNVACEDVIEPLHQPRSQPICHMVRSNHLPPLRYSSSSQLEPERVRAEAAAAARAFAHRDSRNAFNV